MDIDLINLRLLSHPINWLYVWIVLLLASMAFHLIVDGVQANSADASISPD